MSASIHAKLANDMAQLKINLGYALNHPNPETAKQGAEGVMAFLDQLEKALNQQALGNSEIDVELLGPHYRVDCLAVLLANIEDAEFKCSLSLLGQHLWQACSEKHADLQDLTARARKNLMSQMFKEIQNGLLRTVVLLTFAHTRPIESMDPLPLNAWWDVSASETDAQRTERQRFYANKLMKLLEMLSLTRVWVGSGECRSAMAKELGLCQAAVFGYKDGAISPAGHEVLEAANEYLGEKPTIDRARIFYAEMNTGDGRDTTGASSINSSAQPASSNETRGSATDGGEGQSKPASKDAATVSLVEPSVALLWDAMSRLFCVTDGAAEGGSSFDGPASSNAK